MSTTATVPSNRFRPGDPRAIAAGKKSAEVRARKKAERDAAAEEDQALVDRFLEIDLTEHTLGNAALATASLLIKRVAAGKIDVANGTQAAAIIGKLYEIGRLEAGQVTSLTGSVSLQLGDDEVRGRIARARESVEVVGVTVSPDPETSQVTAPPLPSE